MAEALLLLMREMVNTLREQRLQQQREEREERAQRAQRQKEREHFTQQPEEQRERRDLERLLSIQREGHAELFGLLERLWAVWKAFWRLYCIILFGLLRLLREVVFMHWVIVLRMSGTLKLFYLLPLFLPRFAAAYTPSAPGSVAAVSRFGACSLPPVAMLRDEAAEGRARRRQARLANGGRGGGFDSLFSEELRAEAALASLERELQESTPRAPPLQAKPLFELPPRRPQRASRRRRQQQRVAVAPTKVMVFIDGSWLYYQLFGRGRRCPIAAKYGPEWYRGYYVDFGRIPQLVSEHIARSLGAAAEVSRVLVFSSYRPDDSEVASQRQQMFRAMQQLNFEVHLGKYTGGQEKCVDIALAVDMVHYATVPDAFDVAVLVSGDRDFLPALCRVREKGKRVCIASMRNSVRRGGMDPADRAWSTFCADWPSFCAVGPPCFCADGPSLCVGRPRPSSPTRPPISRTARSSGSTTISTARTLSWRRYTPRC